MNEEELKKAIEKANAEKQKKLLLMKVLTKDAYERLARVRLAHPEIAEQAEQVILSWYMQGRIEELNDAQLKALLSKLVK